MERKHHVFLVAILEELRAIRKLLTPQSGEAPALPSVPFRGPWPPCPQCAGPMRLRHRRRDDAPFLGCASYPKCVGIRNIEVDGREQEDAWEADAYNDDVEGEAFRWDQEG